MLELRRFWQLASWSGLLAGLLMFSTLLADDPPSAVSAVLKLLKSGKVPESRLPTIIGLVGSRGNEHDLAFLLAETSRDDYWPVTLRRQSLELLRDAAETRKIVPAGDLQTLLGLLVSSDAELRLSAIQLAGLWKSLAAAGELERLALAGETSPAERTAALNSLVHIDRNQGLQAAQTLAASDASFAVRAQATVALATLDPAAAAQQAAQQLQQADLRDDPSPIVNAFLAIDGGSKRLADAIGRSTIRPDVAKLALREMYSIGRSDAELSSVLSELAGINNNFVPPTREEIARMVSEVEQRGDAARGEQVFRRSDLSCLKCHAVNKAGGQIGPDLSALGSSSPLEYIIASVLDPDQAIKEAYITRSVITLDGRIHQGLVVDRTNERLLLKDANGQTVTVALSDIDEEVEGKSLMPKGLVKFMTQAEFLDLARFLSSLGKPGPYAIRTTQRVQRWRFLAQPAPDLISDIPNESLFEDSTWLKSGWKSAYALVDGRLPLRELADATEHEVIYIQAEVQALQGGPANLCLDDPAGTHLWVNEESVAASEVTAIQLQDGANLFTLRIDLRSRPQPSLKLEFQKIAGSKAEFQVVDGQ